tara:strand:+ start:122 stop:958 length:837 start_codon:yes stop_codon:yes gene_type:complete
MQVIRTVEKMKRVRSGLSGSVGLVATLGGIHVAHTTHMDVIRPQCDTLIGSLFLNPTQFGENEDLSSYPAIEYVDLREFEKHGADIVFAPPVDEVYPKDGSVPVMDPGPVANVLDGLHRPGHFEGVATVVARLFSIIEPHKATFGEKDAQQLRIIRHVVDSLGLDIELIPIPIVRESDGLAVSSRNAYLSSDERSAAVVLFKALMAAAERFSSGERSGDVLRNTMLAVFEDEPLANVEYASVADVDTFLELDEVFDTARALVAVRIGPARLIDNMLLA